MLHQTYSTYTLQPTRIANPSPSNSTQTKEQTEQKTKQGKRFT